MHKKGDVRDDGKVFVRYNEASANGDYWVSRERFLELHKPDWFEWRVRVDRRKAERAAGRVAYGAKLEEWAATRDERKKAQQAKAYERIKERKAIDPGYRAHLAKLSRQSYERLKGTPKFSEKCKRALARHYEKKRPGVEKRKRQREARREFVAVIKEINSRLVERRVQLRMLGVVAKRLLRPVKRLSEAEKLEYKRQSRRAYRQRRRARLRAVYSDLTPKKIGELEAMAGGVCHYCGCEPNYLTLDHVVPLVAGGAHAEDNVVFACHPCNSLKRDLSVEEFLPLIGR